MKKNIALVVDIRNWAFDSIAKNIKKYLSYKYNFEIYYIEDFIEKDFTNYKNLFKTIFLNSKNFVIVHFFWRLELFNFLANINQCDNRIKKMIIKNLIEKKITTCVYDHAFIDINKNYFYYNINLMLLDNLYDSFGVCSKKLFNIYKYKSNKKIFYTPDGVDLNIFKPISSKSIEKKDIFIGWIGNSEWKEIEKEDVKGLKTIIIPAYKKLKSIYKEKNIHLKILDRKNQKKLLSKTEINQWLNSIDIYINASLHEGTPNPVLEAMACGIPVISTNVGVVNEVFGKKQKKLIFKRNLNNLLNKIIFLLKNQQLYKDISQENLHSIKKFEISKTINNYDEFFNYVLNNKIDYLKKSVNLSFFLIELKEFTLKSFLNKIKIKFNLFNKINIGILLSRNKYF